MLGTLSKGGTKKGTKNWVPDFSNGKAKKCRAEPNLATSQWKRTIINET